MSRKNHNQVLFTHRISGCLEHVIGAQGLAPERLARWLDRLRPAIELLRHDYQNNTLPLLHLPERRDDITQAKRALAHLARGAKEIIVFGTGGSSLGGQTLAHFTEWYVPERETTTEPAPRLRFYHNLDATTLHHTLTRFDLETTRFIVISKSGNTAETLLQMLAALQAVEKAGLKEKIGQMFLAITDPAEVRSANGLRDLCAHYGIPVLDHEPGLGGRYAVLSNVGLLPAMIRNLDVLALRAGAKTVVEALLETEDPALFPPAAGAAVACALNAEKGIGIHVLMPYADRLGRLSQWFVQLWAESLGKDGKGTTPIAALGPVDQHSQLQLFLDGPKDHMITLIRTQNHHKGPRIRPDLARLAGVESLAQRTAGDLVEAEQNAIYDALIQAGRPVRSFDIPILNERTLGALLMHFMLEVILAARLLEVDPFDQPAVETGKQLTHNYLSASHAAVL